jgi:hypothetical protein
VARPDVVTAVGALARGGNMASRANAARAVGILRGRAAVPDLLEALRAKDTTLLYESLVALQKIRDESAGPRIAFLLNDLNSKVQIAAIETTGLLRNREAAPDLIGILKRAKDAKVRRAALSSLAMLAPRRDLSSRNTSTTRTRNCAGRGRKAWRDCALRPIRRCLNRRGRTKPKRHRGCRWRSPW